MGSIKHGLFERRKNSEKLFIMTMNTGHNKYWDEKDQKYHNYQVQDVENTMRYVFDQLKENHKMPSIIFIQEPAGVQKVKMHLDFSQLDEGGADYFYAHTRDEVAVVWNNAEFLKLAHIDETWKRKMNPKNQSLYTKIDGRFSGVLLQHRASGYNVLAVSWHGPYKGWNEDKKKEIRSKFLKYLSDLVCLLKQEKQVEYDDDKIRILIGGDFNVDFPEGDETAEEPDFTFCDYKLSNRRKGGNKIDYFVHSKHGISVTNSKNIFDAIHSTYIPLEDIEKEIISLDHDPIIASVEFTPYGQNGSQDKKYYPVDSGKRTDEFPCEDPDFHAEDLDEFTVTGDTMTHVNGYRYYILYNGKKHKVWQCAYCRATVTQENTNFEPGKEKHTCKQTMRLL